MVLSASRVIAFLVLVQLATTLTGAPPRLRIRDSAAILSARCHPGPDDCLADVEYALRTTRHSAVATALDKDELAVRVIVSGRGVNEATIVQPPTQRTVRPIVFIDVGVPPMKRHLPVTPATNRLPDAVRAWVQSVARERPGWEYRFIAGDERVCRISDSVSAAALTGDPTAAWVGVGELPYERLDVMTEIFRTEPRLLVVVAETPPIWLPREASEWATYGNLDIAERRQKGHEQQARVARHEVDADELDFFSEDGFVLLVTGPAPVPDAASTTAKTDTKDDMNRIKVREELGKGVRDLTKADPTLMDPKTFLKRVADLDIVEYRGRATVPLPEIARPASGAYHVKVQLVQARTKSNVIATNESSVLEPAVPNWARATLQWLKRISWALMIGALVIVSIATIVQRGKPKGDTVEITRNALFAIAGTLFGIAVSIGVDADSTLKQRVSLTAASLATVLMLFAMGYWYLFRAKERDDRTA